MACLESRAKMRRTRGKLRRPSPRESRCAPAFHSRASWTTEPAPSWRIKCKKVARMEFESDGRLTLETEPGTEHAIACDVVIFSVGQRQDLALIPEASGIGVAPRRTIAVNEAYAASGQGSARQGMW